MFIIHELMKNKVLFIISFLLYFGTIYGQKSIYDVCRKGTIEELKSIYQNDKNSINVKNKEGHLPITLACYHGNTAVVEFLADKVENIDGNSDYGTPLMAATFKGYNSIIAILLKHKANPNLTDKQGGTAMHYAVMFKNYEAIKLLKKANADFEILDINNKSALDYAKTLNDKKINKILNL